MSYVDKWLFLRVRWSLEDAKPDKALRLLDRLESRHKRRGTPVPGKLYLLRLDAAFQTGDKQLFLEAAKLFREKLVASQVIDENTKNYLILYANQFAHKLNVRRLNYLGNERLKIASVDPKARREFDLEGVDEMGEILLPQSTL